MSSSGHGPVGVRHRGGGRGRCRRRLVLLPARRPGRVVARRGRAACRRPARPRRRGRSDEPSLPPRSTPGEHHHQGHREPQDEEPAPPVHPGGSGPRVIDVMVRTLASQPGPGGGATPCRDRLRPTQWARVQLRDRILAWYDEHARDLPWRGAAASPWSVMVSEFMLQQTPVARVLPGARGVAASAGRPRRAWPPRPPARRSGCGAASATRGGRCGCTPRPTAIVERHGGEVPSAYDDLIALPGVGDYTAAAVATLRLRSPARRARHQRAPGARASRVGGQEFPAPFGDRGRAGPWPADLLPGRRGDRGHLVDRRDGARRPGLHRRQVPAVRPLPGGDVVRLAAAGYPAYDGPRAGRPDLGRHRPPVPRAGCSAVLRDSDGPVHRQPSRRGLVRRDQRARCLAEPGRRRPARPGRRPTTYALP